MMYGKKIRQYFFPKNGVIHPIEHSIVQREILEKCFLND
jgi:hypothetical protein